MPLPAVGNLISGASPPGMPDATCNTPPVAAGKATLNAKNGYASWAGNKLVIAATGGSNYWYIPQAEAGCANYCVVPCNGLGGEAYVVSDNYGGCEYHELYNATYNILAFLHVHRGGGTIANYTPAAGWAVRSVKRSWAIAATIGSNWSISCITPGAPPTVASKFIRVGGFPALTVQGEDSGDAPYPPAPVVAAPAPVPAPGLLTGLKKFFKIG